MMHVTARQRARFYYRQPGSDFSISPLLLRSSCSAWRCEIAGTRHHLRANDNAAAAAAAAITLMQMHFHGLD